MNNYSLLEKIGSGSYATVYKALKKDGSREIVAIKWVDTSSLSKTAIDNIVREIYLLKVLKHENIVEMKDFFLDHGSVYIVMEYCDGGDLSSFIKQKHRLPEHICRRFLQQLAMALKYLHHRNVSHMDLKPQNLLLARRPRLTLKVGDFGFAQILSNSKQKLAICGSPLYMAPEMLANNKYDARVDLWSVGVIIYECLFGKAPYSSSSLKELVGKIKSGQPFEVPKGSQVSNECKDLLMGLLKHNPEDRISFAEFFGHDFLDLNHAPTREHYDEAVKLVQKAVEADTEKNVKNAFYLYCEALRYFIPLLTSETDSKRREALRQRVNDYMKRAEELKIESMKHNMSADRDKTTDAQCKATACSLQWIPSTNQTLSSVYSDLRTLSKSTSGMVDALEIGEVAEQYFAECNYALALEKFKSSLGILVPLLGKEPPGRRKDLLCRQVQYWMKEAESTKALLACQNVTNSTERSPDSYAHCIVQ